MNLVDVNVMLPFIILTLTVVALMLLISFRRHHALTLIVTVAGLLLALLSLPWAAWAAPQEVTPILIIDSYAVLYIGIFLSAGLAIVLASGRYFDGARTASTIPPDEFYVLLVLAIIGSATLACSQHFVSLFLGLELLSTALYALVGYPLFRERSLEAGLKYLILAATSSAFLVFGIALLYAGWGTLSFDPSAQTATDVPSILPVAGFAMVLVGAGFKLGVTPFHLWTPDVYEGAPTPVTAFIATVSKGGILALLLRYFFIMERDMPSGIFAALALIAAASMLAGNLLALLQSNVKRILAYSSIAHLGYVLVAMLATGELAAPAVTFYLIAYFATTIAAFGVVGAMSCADREMDRLKDYQGLAWRHPWLALTFTAALLSLAGIPLTGGFIGKFYVVAAGADAALWTLLFMLVVGSVIGLFYYLRILVTLFTPAEEKETAGGPSPALSTDVFAGAATFALGAMVLLLFWLGTFPVPFLRLIQNTL